MTNVAFEQIPIQECGEPLVDLAQFSFALEPAYFNQGLSDSPNLYARQSIVDKLLRIQDQFNGLSFKIWDPWRSRIVQNNIYTKYWHELEDQHPDWNDERLKLEVGRFVTAANNPNRIPPHATGGAIDLTLVDKQGKELDMGTGFDHFGPEAASLYFENDSQDYAIRSNRKLLREAMQSEGFRVDDDEWWHYDYGNQIWAAALNLEFAIYGEKVSAPS